MLPDDCIVAAAGVESAISETEFSSMGAAAAFNELCVITGIRSRRPNLRDVTPNLDSLEITEIQDSAEFDASLL